MEKLTLGKVTNKDLAEWFGIRADTFSKKRNEKLEELKCFAEFHIDGKKIIIDKVINPIYSKQGSSNYQKVVNKIDEVWDESGLDSCVRVGQEIYDILTEEDDEFTLADSTVYNYTRQGRNELYGRPFSEGGRLGNCIYTWCKTDEETGRYIKLNSEEIKIKELLQLKYFGDATEKQILVNAMVESGEISEEEAWGVLKNLTGMNKNSFYEFLTELQEKLGCKIVRGTYVRRNAFILEGE